MFLLRSGHKNALSGHAIDVLRCFMGEGGSAAVLCGGRDRIVEEINSTIALCSRPSRRIFHQNSALAKQFFN